MKKLTYLLSLLAAVTLLVITNCKPDPDPDPDPVEEQLEKIGKTWAVTKVTLDGNDVTSDYDGMTLTITADKGYTVGPENSDFSPVWPSSGTFTFKNENTETPDVNTIIRQDSDQDIEISIVTVTETNLSLEFNYTLAGGRITGLEGDYVFDFQAQ